MLNTSLGTPLERLAHVRPAQGQENDAGNDIWWITLWDYQKCTEFAFFHTCEKGSNCFFVQGLNSLDDPPSGRRPDSSLFYCARAQRELSTSLNFAAAPSACQMAGRARVTKRTAGGASRSPTEAASCPESAHFLPMPRTSTTFWRVLMAPC